MPIVATDAAEALAGSTQTAKAAASSMRPIRRRGRLLVVVSCMVVLLCGWDGVVGWLGVGIASVSFQGSSR
jgi:hypothetical protein